MAKARKTKKRRHLKKNVRWTIASLLMATAVIIALIPVQNGGVSAFNSSTDEPNVQVNLYTVDELLSSPHKTDYASKIDDDADAYKTYLVNTYYESGALIGDDGEVVNIDDYDDIVIDPTQQSQTANIKSTQNKKEISTNGGSSYSPVTPAQKASAYYVLCDASGNDIDNPTKAVQQFTVDKNSDNVIARYIGDGTINQLSPYDQMDPSRLGVGYASEIPVKASNEGNPVGFYVIADSNYEGSATYEIAKKPQEAIDEEGNPVLDEENNPVQATDADGNLLWEVDPVQTQTNREAAVLDAQSAREAAAPIQTYVCAVDKIANIDTIGGSAYRGATVPNLNLSDSNIKTIGDAAFAESKGGTNIVLPSSIQKIGTAAFYGTGASTLNMNPTSTVEMGCAVFANNTSLATDMDGNEIMMNNVTKIGNGSDHTTGDSSTHVYTTCGTFANCSKLPTVYFPDYVGALPRGTFANDTALQYVTVGNDNNLSTTFDQTVGTENEFGQSLDANPDLYIWGRFNEQNNQLSAAHKYAFKKNIPYRYDLGDTDQEKYSFLNSDGYIYNVVVPKGSGDAYIESIIGNTDGTLGTTAQETMNIPYRVGNYNIKGINTQAAYGPSKNISAKTIKIPATIETIGDEAFRQISSLETVEFTLEKGRVNGNMTYFSDYEDYPTTIGNYCFEGDTNLTLVDFKTFDEVQRDNRCCKMGTIAPGAFFTGTPDSKDLVFRSCIPPDNAYDPNSKTYPGYGQYNYCVDTDEYQPSVGITVPKCAFSTKGWGIKYETDVPELISFRYIPYIDDGKGVVTLMDYPAAGTETHLSDYGFTGFDKAGDCLQKYYDVNGEITTADALVVKTGACIDTITIPYGVTSIVGTGPIDGVEHLTHAGELTSYFRDLDGTKTLNLRDVEKFPEGAFATVKLPSDSTSSLTQVIFGNDVKNLGPVDPSENGITPFDNSKKVNNVQFSGYENSYDDGRSNPSNISYAYQNGIIYAYGSVEKQAGKYTPYNEIVECLDIRGDADAGLYIMPSCMDVNAENDPGITAVTRVGKHAFDNNKGLYNVDLSESMLESMEEYAFNECSLTFLELPESFRSAKKGSLSNTIKVTVDCPNTQANFPIDVFDGNEGPTKHTIIKSFAVPDGLKNAIDDIHETDDSAIFLEKDVELSVFFYVTNPDTGEEFQFKSNGAQIVPYNGDAKDPADDMSYVKSDLESFGIDLNKWVFAGWQDPAQLKNITVDNLKIYAKLIPKEPVATHTVTFQYKDPTGTDPVLHDLGEDNNKYRPQTVIDGENAPNYPTMDESKLYLNSKYPGWKFDGWTLGDPEEKCQNITQDMPFVAIFTKSGTYTVRFQYQDPSGKDSTVHDLGEKNPDYSPQTVKEGENARVPDMVLSKTYVDVYPDYEFTGWTPDLSNCQNVNQDWTFKAQYNLKYKGPKATFMDYDGTILHTEYVDKGSVPNGPKRDPSRPGYTFLGWKPDATKPIEEDTTYIAQYVQNSSSSSSSSRTTSSSQGGSSSTPGPTSSSRSTSSSSSSSSRSTSSSNSSSSAQPVGPVIVSGAPAPYVGANGTPIVPGTAGTVTTGNGGTSNNVPAGNTNVISTAPGITDNGKMSATVNGSSDNYIIKITETDEADNMAVQALSGAYGTLDNIRYMPFDISLYDSTGTQKISPVPDGITVSVTMPIPDDLTIYGGNNKIASTRNGSLENLQPRFTVIDGVPCMNFTVTHLSPYVIYVDTANLQAGTLDSTPKTADPIHPKWFLCIGLAAISIFLFLKRDQDSRRRIA